jgi:hypothetical protein
VCAEARFASLGGSIVTWETRRGRGCYYTRTRREDGRRIREYIGIGQEARRAAEEDEARRRQVEAERDAARALAEDVQTLSELADLLARAALLAAGYHRPNRGLWRKRRVRKKTIAATPRPQESPRGATPGPDTAVA